jgi:uncharacterized membrane protein
MNIINPLPMQSAGAGFIAGAAMGAHDAATPGNALVAGLTGAILGAVGGGIAARRDAKIARQENPELRNKTQLGKYGK